ncbi:hypothetical protein [Microbacterium sp. LWH3-1.2]|uniref:hypothetical protein n=1 Tax=Microbacterium sp. LWH3-1.2 TaxID=3135256 RepID=UPI003426AF4E
MAVRRAFTARDRRPPWIGARCRALAPTRRHVNVAEFAMYRVRGGRITEFSGSVSRFAILDQLTGSSASG